MEKKVIEFRKGDIIVSGGGNIGIFNGVVNGYMGERLTPYCESTAPAGTDMRYARHATEEEKKLFFEVLNDNGYIWEPDTFTIYHDDRELGNSFKVAKVDWKADSMHPFKVIDEKKKRVRATWTQVRELERAVIERDNLIDEMKELMERQSSTLEKANFHINKMRDENIALRSENERLLSRSFLERLFNK